MYFLIFMEESFNESHNFQNHLNSQNAITTKIRTECSDPRKNLLDYSIEKYGQQLVDDIRTLRRTLVLYLPLPIFWTLFSLPSSRWIFQAKYMNGDIGYYIIRPDQIPMLGSILLLVMIPLFDTVVYPVLRKFGIRRPLQKMVIGGVLTAISFVLTAIVQFQIEASPKNTVHMLWQLPQYFCLTAGEIMFQLIGNKIC